MDFPPSPTSSEMDNEAASNLAGHPVSTPPPSLALPQFAGLSEGSTESFSSSGTPSQSPIDPCEQALWEEMFPEEQSSLGKRARSDSLSDLLQHPSPGWEPKGNFSFMDELHDESCPFAPQPMPIVGCTEAFGSSIENTFGMPCLPFAILRCFWKLSYRAPYGEQSNVSFSLTSRIGKHRMFSLTQCDPSIFFVQVQFESTSTYSLGLSLRNNSKVSAPVIQILVNKSEAFFYVFPIAPSRSANQIKHTLLIQCFDSNRQLLSSHRLHDMYSASHKHESTQMQRSFLQANDTEAALSSSGEVWIRPTSQHHHE